MKKQKKKKHDEDALLRAAADAEQKKREQDEWVDAHRDFAAWVTDPTDERAAPFVNLKDGGQSWKGVFMAEHVAPADHTVLGGYRGGFFICVHYNSAHFHLYQARLVFRRARALAVTRRLGGSTEDPIPITAGTGKDG
jgi:hypothetical protein